MTEPELTGLDRIAAVPARTEDNEAGHAHETFTPNAEMDAMQRMLETEPARFDQLFTGAKRIQVGLYIGAKQRHEARVRG